MSLWMYSLRSAFTLHIVANTRFIILLIYILYQHIRFHPFGLLNSQVYV